MKIRDIPPGEFFTLPRTGHVWWKLYSRDYGISAGKQIAVVMSDSHPNGLLSLSVWETSYEVEEYEIIPPEDV